MRNIVYTLALMLIPFLAFASEENINTRIQNTIMLRPGLDPVTGLKERFADGKNIQIACSIPGADERGGDLLDPNSVKVFWNEVELETFVLYRLNSIAMIFALPNPELLKEQPEGELSFNASLVGSDNIDGGWKLPMVLEHDLLTTMSLSIETRGGRKIYVGDEHDEPVTDAYIFGQRREDLFTKTNADGFAMLDAPSRNAPGGHYAWKEGYWTREFDPVSEPEIQLVPKSGNTVRRMISLRHADGSPVAQCVLLVDMNYYKIYTDGEKNFVDLPADRESMIWCVAAGADPQWIKAEPVVEKLAFKFKAPE